VDSPAPVSLNHQISTLCVHSPAHPLGKTTFLKFLLARLISARQVVLFGNQDTFYLFYHGKVYEKKEQIRNDLPRLFQNMCYQPAWALIDGDGMTKVPFNVDDKIWPILATSPQPDRWKSWYRQLGAPIWGMAKWNFKELTAWYA
jgi:hypothetical protein